MEARVVAAAAAVLESGVIKGAHGIFMYSEVDPWDSYVL